MHMAIPWYPSEEFPKFRALCDDADQMSPTYEIWLAGAESHVKEMELLGHEVHRVVVNYNDFAIWCAEKGMYVNSEARMHYASYLLAKSLGFGG